MDYYLNTHPPLVREWLTPAGLVSVDLEVGLADGTPDSPPAYVMIGRLKQ